ncbi:MAG TPA: hypothetical protein VGR84_06370 [Candidatus Acidoferrales bacterium]|nr:hypothetical protein [Candidatus Acidoferrales bacterium]
MGEVKRGGVRQYIQAEAWTTQGEKQIPRRMAPRNDNEKQSGVEPPHSKGTQFTIGFFVF